MKSILLFLILNIATISNAQICFDTLSIRTIKGVACPFVGDSSRLNVVEFPDVEAEFPGGITVLMDYIAQNLIYPKSGGDFSGKIYLSFIVNIDGTISDVIVERGINAELDRMSRNLILGMPRWKPAQTDGKKVKSQIRLPIIIN